MTDKPVVQEKTFASHIGEDGNFTEGWKDTLPEEIRGEKCLDLVTNPVEMAKSYVHARKSFGKDKVAIPNETSPQEDIEAFHKAWGKPETAGDYKFDRDEAIPEEHWDTEKVNQFKEGAHALGFNAQQMAYIEQFYNTDLKSSLEALSQAQEQAMQAAEQSLKEEWGDAYQERLHLCNRLITETTEEGEERDVLLDKIGNDPIVAKWMSKMGMKLVESKSVDTKVHMQTPAEIEAEIAELQATPGYMDGTMKINNPKGFEVLQNKIEAKFKQAYPD